MTLTLQHSTLNQLQGPQILRFKQIASSLKMIWHLDLVNISIMESLHKTQSKSRSASRGMNSIEITYLDPELTFLNEPTLSQSKQFNQLNSKKFKVASIRQLTLLLGLVHMILAISLALKVRVRRLVRNDPSKWNRTRLGQETTKLRRLTKSLGILKGLFNFKIKQVEKLCKLTLKSVQVLTRLNLSLEKISNKWRSAVKLSQWVGTIIQDLVIIM